MRPYDAERVEERAEHRNHGPQIMGEPLRQRRRRAETGQVHGYDVPFERQDAQDRVPCLTVVAYAVQQHQRFARTGPLVRHIDRTRSGGRADCERNRGGHAAPRTVLPDGRTDADGTRRLGKPRQLQHP